MDQQVVVVQPAPTKPAWITLIVSWLTYLLPLPGISTIVGGFLGVAALIVSVIVIGLSAHCSCWQNAVFQPSSSTGPPVDR